MTEKATAIFCAHYYTTGLQEMFAVKIKKFYFQYLLHKVLEGGSWHWWVRLIIFVVVLANDFDPSFLWDISIEWADIECSKDCVVWKWCVFNETNVC